MRSQLRMLSFQIRKIQRYRDICVKSSSVFLRRCKQDKHEMLYVKRLLDKKMKDYIKNLYPKALSNTKKVRKVKNGDVSSTFETERAVPPQILIVRDICGSGKTTYAIENALSLGDFINKYFNINSKLIGSAANFLHISSHKTNML